MQCGIRNDALDMTIGVDALPYRKKPCLVILEGNREIKYASFNNTESAKEFMEKLAQLVGLDWSKENAGIE